MPRCDAPASFIDGASHEQIEAIENQQAALMQKVAQQHRDEITALMARGAIDSPDECVDGW